MLHARESRSFLIFPACSLTLNVRKMFQEIDGQLYERCRQHCEQVEQQLDGLLEGQQGLE